MCNLMMAGGGVRERGGERDGKWVWEGRATRAGNKERVGKKSELLCCVCALLSLTFVKPFEICNSEREREREREKETAEFQTERKKVWK